jgi:hypothetical protein
LFMLNNGNHFLVQARGVLLFLGLTAGPSAALLLENA